MFFRRFVSRWFFKLIGRNVRFWHGSTSVPRCAFRMLGLFEASAFSLLNFQRQCSTTVIILSRWRNRNGAKVNSAFSKVKFSSPSVGLVVYDYVHSVILFHKFRIDSFNFGLDSGCGVYIELLIYRRVVLVYGLILIIVDQNGLTSTSPSWLHLWLLECWSKWFAQVILTSWKEYYNIWLLSTAADHFQTFFFFWNWLFH